MVVVVVVALAIPTLPAFASSVDPIVFFPRGNGATYSCTGGPPFVFDAHSDSMGNCSVDGVGPPPAGLVCEDPATITFMHEGHDFTDEAKLCDSGVDAAGSPDVTSSDTNTNPD